MKLYGFNDPYSKRWVFEELQTKYTTHVIEDSAITVCLPLVCKHTNIVPAYGTGNGFLCKQCDLEMVPITFIPKYEIESNK